MVATVLTFGFLETFLVGLFGALLEGFLLLRLGMKNRQGAMLVRDLLALGSTYDQVKELAKLCWKFLTFATYLALLYRFYTLIERFGFVRSFYWMKRKMARRSIKRKSYFDAAPLLKIYIQVSILCSANLIPNPANSRATCCSPFLTAALTFAAAASSRRFLSHAYRERD